MAKSQLEKLEQKLADAQRMLQNNLDLGRGEDDYNVQKLRNEIKDAQIAIDKHNKVSAKTFNKDLADANTIKQGNCVDNHADRVYDLYKKGFLTQSEAMNQDF